MSDRIVVMRDGRISGRFEAAEASEEKIMQCAVTGRAAA
jgi:ribose transport system ATP-binding protein